MPKATHETAPKTAAASPYDKPAAASKPQDYVNNRHFKLRMYEEKGKGSNKDVIQKIAITFGPSEGTCHNRKVNSPMLVLRSSEARLMGIYKDREGGKPDRAFQLINIDMTKLDDEARVWLRDQIGEHEDSFKVRLARRLWDEAAGNDKILEFKNKAIEQVRDMLDGGQPESVIMDKAFKVFMKQRVHMRLGKAVSPDSEYARPQTGDEFDLIEAQFSHDLFSRWGKGLPAHAANRADAAQVRQVEAQYGVRYDPVAKKDRYNRPSDRFLCRGDSVRVRYYVQITATDLGDISVKHKADLVFVAEEGAPGGNGADDDDGFEALEDPPSDDGFGGDGAAANVSSTGFSA